MLVNKQTFNEVNIFKTNVTFQNYFEGIKNKSYFWA